MSNKTLVVSSSNLGKIKEIKSILSGLNLNIVSKSEVGLSDLEVIEDKDTLEDNAIKKALEIHKHTKGIVMSDDSGLFVDYLKGSPGVYSARYAGVDGDDEANNKKLLDSLKEVALENRTAKFKTVIAIVLEDSSVEIVVGKCSGKIITEQRGDSGFGYDPLFVPDGFDETFAQLDSAIKNKISHRRDALEKLKIKLENII